MASFDVTLCAVCGEPMRVFSPRGVRVHECQLRAGTTGGSGAWVGVIREGRRVVWTCGHRHANRDQSGYCRGPSARDCATEELRERQSPGSRAAVRRSGHLTVADRMAQDRKPTPR